MKKTKPSYGVIFSFKTLFWSSVIIFIIALIGLYFFGHLNTVTIILAIPYSILASFAAAVRYNADRVYKKEIEENGK